MAGMNVTRAGAINQVVDSIPTFAANYVNGGLPDPDVGVSYEVNMHQVSGNTLTGNNAGLDVWLTISTTLAWDYNDTPSAFKMGSFTYQIRNIATPSNASNVCTFTPETEDGS